MAATAGKKVRLKISGAPIAFVADPMTNSGDSKTYTITNAAKRVWDPSVAITVFYNAVLQPAASYTINRLTGQVTFTAAQGASAVTVTGSYLPTTTIAEGKSFSFSGKGINGEDNAFGDTDITRQQLQRTCSGAIGQWWLDNAFHAAFLALAVLVVEISIADGATPIARAWALLTERAHEVANGGLQEEPLTWEGSADVDNRSFAFLV
jgi:hypothetical protein